MGDFKDDLYSETEEDSKEELSPPKMYRVVLHNDDYTTMEFVVHVLENVFRKSTVDATRIMMEVHNSGRGVCGVYRHEVAETKVAMVHHLAKQYEFPLRSSMEDV